MYKGTPTPSSGTAGSTMNSVKFSLMARIYTERDTSLHEITLPLETSGHLIQAMDSTKLEGVGQKLTRTRRFSDTPPGRIFAQGHPSQNHYGEISNVKFAEARKISDAQKLTKKSEDSSAPIVACIHTVCRSSGHFQLHVEKLPR